MILEKSFPLEKVQTLTKIESQRRQFYRPIYSLHKSWARRPGTLFRAVGLTHFYPSQLFSGEDLKKSPYYHNHSFKNSIVLDPFAGGGTTLVEFNRLGIRTIGIDTNPVAWFTTKKELEFFDLNEFNNEADRIFFKIGEKIQSYYKTDCPACGNKNADIMYTFWVRKITCPSCNSKQDLFKYYIIGKKQRQHQKTCLICPKCNFLFYSKKQLNGESICPSCLKHFYPLKGNCRKKIFICTCCGNEFKLLDVLKNSSEGLNQKQIAIEYFCPSCRSRDYKKISKTDLDLYKKTKDEFEELKDELLYPRTKLPRSGVNIRNLINYGFEFFADLFNPRQLLCLSLLLKEISQITSERVQEYFLLAFSSSLEFHTVLCPYNYTMKQIVNIFNYQSFLVPLLYVENNVWGTEKGNGTFKTYLDRIRKAKNYCVKPFEIFSENGKITKIPILGERINAEMVEDFASLKRSSTPSSYLICGSSMQLTLYGIESKSIDIVATDPPYFDFIQYSELANFFYVWLRIVLESRYSAFKSELISSYAELGSDKKPSQFLAGLTNVFKECYRVLKEKAPLVFTFHHSSDSAWGIILQSIFLSNFVVTAAYPIHSEFKARPTTGRNYDILLICRKRESLIKINTVSWKEIKEKVKKEVQIVQNCKNKETYKWEETFSNIIPLISSSLTPELLSDLNSDLKEVFSLLQ